MDKRRLKIAGVGDLCVSLSNYSGALGEWWYRQAENAAHRYAYRRIADYLADSLPRPPRLIVDYACGAGHLITLLAARFEESRFVGIDGSPCLLNLAKRKVRSLGCDAERRVILMQESLPDSAPTGISADLVVYSFPNMVPSSREAEFSYARCLSGADVSVARALLRHPRRRARRLHHRSAAELPRLLLGRMVSRNLRGLLRRDGICARVEYAKARRSELTRNELLKVEFEEGTLDGTVSGNRPECWFRVAASSYFRSGVMRDVYQQSGYSSDRKGGYVITVLRAV